VQDQETVLMAAAFKGNVGIVRKLIQHGANVNLTDKVTSPMFGVTPGTLIFGLYCVEHVHTG